MAVQLEVVVAELQICIYRRPPLQHAASRLSTDSRAVMQRPSAFHTLPPHFIVQQYVTHCPVGVVCRNDGEEPALDARKDEAALAASLLAGGARHFVIVVQSLLSSARHAASPASSLSLQADIIIGMCHTSSSSAISGGRWVQRPEAGALQRNAAVG